MIRYLERSRTTLQLHLIQHWIRTIVRNRTKAPRSAVPNRTYVSIRTVCVIMKLQALILFATLAVAVAQEFLQEDENRDVKEDAEWENFKVFYLFELFIMYITLKMFHRLQSRFKKRFKNKDREKIRKNTFVENNRAIKKHNQAGKSTYKLQPNQFADWVRISYSKFILISLWTSALTFFWGG